MTLQMSLQDYKVGIICALPRERTAVELMLDGQPHPRIDCPIDDRNTYTFGSISGHNVVIASLGAGAYGTVSAAGVASDVQRTFPHLRFGLMVGIAGGVPRPNSEEGDIRLGDIVVGCKNGVPSVINYKSGKVTAGGFENRSELSQPPDVLSRAVSALDSQHSRLGPTYLIHLSKMLREKPRSNNEQVRRDYYNIPNQTDRLFRADFVHPAGRYDCETCAATVNAEVVREPRALRNPPDELGAEKFIRPGQGNLTDYPAVFLGTIGSADTLMKLASERDEVCAMVKEQRKAEVLCFEMEASGIVNNWPCLVIRGICDYSDSHKNDDWQNFAAATAAAYAKDLLSIIQPQRVAAQATLSATLNSAAQGPQQSGSGNTYTNSGSGSQRISHQSGTNNRQFNAKTMNFSGGW